ncbi:MAG: peptide chain release factor 1 [Candidatus Neomarinimicrobiota bacterium]
MITKLQQIIDHFEALERSLTDPQILADNSKVIEISKERSALVEVVEQAKEYVAINEQIEEYHEILSGEDDDLKEIAKDDLPVVEAELKKCEEKLKVLLIPKDPNDDKNIIVEIRAGTGGDEAALFVSDLFRMYSRFAERLNWQYHVMDANSTGIGGFKEIVFSVAGKGAYGKMKYESGVHRVQRVPKTEASGRVHTSAATVAILPEAEEADIEVRNEDLKIDTYRASGAGGQHVNKTESAIRITHIPTGLVVTCQDESSQHKNRAAALKVLRSRLLAAEEDRIASERAKERKTLVSTGDRSAKIRTYNFPQGRITDHRINFTAYQLDAMLDGDISEMIDQLRIAEQQENLKGE